MNYKKGEWTVEAIEDLDNLEVMSPDTPICHISNYCDEDIRVANANLIAAAPMMYEALLISKEYFNSNNVYSGDMYESITKALSKAEGKL